MPFGKDYRISVELVPILWHFQIIFSKSYNFWEKQEVMTFEVNLNGGLIMEKNFERLFNHNPYINKREITAFVYL